MPGRQKKVHPIEREKKFLKKKAQLFSSSVSVKIIILGSFLGAVTFFRTALS
jgi:hypothetical protein